MPFSLYIHLPFCTSRCPYCAFASSTDSRHRIPEYLDALRRELALRRDREPYAGEPDTIYIGGGTPSLVPAADIGELLAAVSGPGTSEITVEANPESMTPAWLEGILKAGANRLSIGVQSFDDAVLSRLGRIHDAATASRAIKSARAAGFGNVSVDLIYGVPGQTQEIWRETITRVIDQGPEHVSCYALSVEEDTDFFQRFGDRPELLSDDDAITDMYLAMRDMLDAAGYDWYEISNLAKPGYECRHNQHYWDFSPYIGAGASAHSFDGVRRFWNVPIIDAYINRVHAGIVPEEESEMIDADRGRYERIMLTLRTRKGLNPEYLSPMVQEGGGLHGYVQQLVRRGCMVIEGGNLVLTPAGAMLSDEICSDIVSLIQPM